MEEGKGSEKKENKQKENEKKENKQKENDNLYLYIYMASVDLLQIADERMDGYLYQIEEKETRGREARWYKNELRYPLHIAASEGKPEIVKYLLDNGVEVDAEDEFRDGVTPLSIALIKGLMANKRDSKQYLQTISLLLERGAKVNNIVFPYDGSEVIGDGIDLTDGDFTGEDGDGAMAIAREAEDRPGENHRMEIYNLLNNARSEEMPVVMPNPEAPPAA